MHKFYVAQKVYKPNSKSNLDGAIWDNEKAVI